MKIGFFGDSFCEEESNPHSWYYNYETYIRKIKNHYNADIVNLGVGSSSYWDSIIQQFPKFSNNLPDVSIFCWTDPNRIYHPKIRNLGVWLLSSIPLKDLTIGQIINHKAYTAAKQYFTHLYDDDKAMREMNAALYQFDREVLMPIQHKTKIIHMWSFGQFKEWRGLENTWKTDNLNYNYRWRTGVEIRPALKCYSPIGRDSTDEGASANHLGSELNNTMVFDRLVEAIDNHKNGLLLTRDV